MKVCSKCKIEKSKLEFTKDKRAKSGLKSQCRECARSYKAANAEKIAEYQRVYRSENSGKLAASGREYYAANKDVIASRQREYYAKNTEKIAAYHREYYIANSEIRLSISKAWHKANPDKRSAIKRNRRARDRKAAGSHTASDVKAIFESQRGLCATCETKLIKSGKNRYHVDHIQPLSKGGSNDKYNLQCLCQSCNTRKHAKDPSSWAKEIGKLL